MQGLVEFIASNKGAFIETLMSAQSIDVSLAAQGAPPHFIDTFQVPHQPNLACYKVACVCQLHAVSPGAHSCDKRRAGSAEHRQRNSGCRPPHHHLWWCAHAIRGRAHALDAALPGLNSSVALAVAVRLAARWRPRQPAARAATTRRPRRGRRAAVVIAARAGGAAGAAELGGAGRGARWRPCVVCSCRGSAMR